MWNESESLLPSGADSSAQHRLDDPPKSTSSPKTRDHGSCNLCRHFDLAFSHFNINGRQPVRQRLAKGETTAKFSPRYANCRFFLGTYKAIKESAGAGCPFCYLVEKSVDNSLDIEDVEKSKCFLTWELDGRSSDGKDQSATAKTRRIHIQWDDSMIPDAFAVFITPRESSDLVTTDANAIWTQSDHFRARKIKQYASRIALIRSWIEKCIHDHQGSCRDRFDLEKRSFEEIANAAHFGVIDIVEMKLTRLPRRLEDGRKMRGNPSGGNPSELRLSTDESGDPRTADSEHHDPLFEPFVALSYVWGGEEDQKAFKSLRTNLENVLTRAFPHALEEEMKKMPKAIQSSVELVRRLGYRYLWIDSLCIVQDSPRSWKWNSEVMDRIYSNAEFTICAADGKSAKAGLIAFDSPEKAKIQDIKRCAPGVELMISRDVESQVASSAWNNRAWTFQERLLSRRCLIFTQNRVFFQCRMATFSEDIVAAPQTTELSAWSLDLVRSPLALLKQLQERPFWFFMKCVELYSGRALTRPEDILAAFRGVLNLIQGVMTGTFVFGLPTSHFDLALLWMPKRAMKRRGRIGEFPSWSWCGWEGGSVTYMDQEFIQECLENVHHWLITHTWIQWHIRDHQSKLRPLWLTGECCLAKQDDRWKGYDSEQVDPGETNDRNRNGEPWESEDEFAPSTLPLPPPPRAVRARSPLIHHHYRPHDCEYGRLWPDEISRRNGFIPDKFDLGNRVYKADIEILNNNQREAPWLLEQDDTSSGEVTDLDPYGRRFLRGWRQKDMKFQKRAPESPFAVQMAPLISQLPSDGDSPTLQFWTDSIWLYLVEPSDDPHYTEPGRADCGPGLKRYGIADIVGDWCGSIVLSEEWVQKKMHQTHNGGREPSFEFLALSRAKKFTRDECETWSYYVPLDRQQSEWNLNYVMLVEVENSVRYRVGVGKVFRHAFQNGVKGKSRWEEIVLG